MKKSDNFINININRTNNFIYAGIDGNGDVCYLEIPELFSEYKSVIEEVVLGVFCFKSVNSVPDWFITYMSNRGIVHDFIEKYLNIFFNEITTEEQLEEMIKKELLGMIQDEVSDVEKVIDEDTYRLYNKAISIKSYLCRLFEFCLSDYKKRLDSVKL